MRAVQVLNTEKASVTVIQSAVVAMMALAGSPPAALTKAQFTRADLAAAGLESADVSVEMRGESFTIAAVLPWFEQVRRGAADALAEM